MRTALEKCNRKAFPNGKNRIVGRNAYVYAGVPSFAADVGAICWDSTNSNAYICTVASGTWVKINA